MLSRIIFENVGYGHIFQARISCPNIGKFLINSTPEDQGGSIEVKPGGGLDQNESGAYEELRMLKSVLEVNVPRIFTKTVITYSFIVDFRAISLYINHVFTRFSVTCL